MSHLTLDWWTFVLLMWAKPSHKTLMDFLLSHCGWSLLVESFSKFTEMFRATKSLASFDNMTHMFKIWRVCLVLKVWVYHVGNLCPKIRTMLTMMMIYSAFSLLSRRCLLIRSFGPLPKINVTVPKIKESVQNLVQNKQYRRWTIWLHGLLCSYAQGINLKKMYSVAFDYNCRFGWEWWNEAGVHQRDFPTTPLWDWGRGSLIPERSRWG